MGLSSCVLSPAAVAPIRRRKAQRNRLLRGRAEISKAEPRACVAVQGRTRHSVSTDSVDLVQLAALSRNPLAVNPCSALLTPLPLPIAGPQALPHRRRLEALPELGTAQGV